MEHEAGILQSYLAAHPALHETTEQWPIQGTLRLRLALATTLPPAHVSSSILAIVMAPDRRVLCLWPEDMSGSIAHLVIGGRPEPGETPGLTATREVAEETGWRIRPIRMIGFRHFFHLEPRSEKTDRPYPDFIQPIYAATALEFDESLLIPTDRIPAAFLDFQTAFHATAPAQRPLLKAAAEAL